MRLRFPLAVVAGTTAVALGTAALATGAQSPGLVIRHQVRGCHAWALAGGPYRVHQYVRVAPGGSLTVTNNDLMAQELVKTSGPPVRRQLIRQSHMGDMPMAMTMGKPGPYTMSHMGAKLRVTFSHPGTYRFKLVDRGDYVEVETKGPDHELTLQVVVG